MYASDGSAGIFATNKMMFRFVFCHQDPDDGGSTYL
jgi:hypothetical protein